MQTALHLALYLAAFFAIRLTPGWPLRHRGCDAYFFLLCAESFRANRRIPVTLPGLYLLEPDEQWYPPGFMVLLGLLPRRLLSAGYFLVNHALDSAVAAALFALCAAQTGLGWAWATGLAYAISISLIREYAGMISRPLGVILFFAMAAATWLSLDHGIPALAAAVFFGALLFYTHKMSMQLTWFLFPLLSLLRMEPQWALVLAGSYLLPALATPRLFVKIVRAHWDIVSFWNRNYRRGGGHTVKGSPVYGEDRAGELHCKRNLAMLAYHARTLAAANPWALLLPVALFCVPGPLAEPLRLFLQMTAGTMLWAYLTMAVPFLRCLGEGHKYVKYTLPIALAASALLLAGPPAAVPLGLGALLLAKAAHHYVLYWREVRATAAQPTIANADDLEPVFRVLAGGEPKRIMCLPLQLADSVAWHARQPVLWGTHGYGFRNAEPIFPVFQKPVEFFLETYALTHLLLDETFTSVEELRIAQATQLVHSSGRYRLYRFLRGGAEATAGTPS